jgi:glycosyltransferase involved in cell wall biosynthesis
MSDDFINHIKVIGRGLPLWAQMAARIPFLFLFACEFLMRRFHRRKNLKSSRCHTISIIIPTLNEAANILSCIQSVSVNRHVCEIIVVDAGSTDQTQVLARQAGAKVIVHDKPIENGGGRGGQIEAGIRAATGDVAAIVHADARLPGHEIDRMIAVLNHHPSIVGGAIGCRFDSPLRKFRFIELANDVRVAFFIVSFGDQVQFFRRQPVVEADLFPVIPLMEDVEFSIRLRRLGRCAYLFGNVCVSIRRWEQKGFRNAAWVFAEVFKYLVKRLWATPDAADLYRRYYQ